MNNGNVCIRTTSPSETLTVVGSASHFGPLNVTSLNATNLGFRFLTGGLFLSCTP